MPFCYPSSMTTLNNLTKSTTLILCLVLTGIGTIAMAKQTEPPDNASIVVESSDCLESIIRFQTSKFKQIDEHTYKLDFGPVLVQADRDTIINTPGCSVDIKDKAIALIAVSPTYTRIFNLHESWKDNLKILLSEDNPFHMAISVGPGQDIAIIRSQNDKIAERIYLDDRVHRRKISHHKLKNDGHIYRARYSILDLFKHNYLLKAANRSKERHAKHLMGKVLRTAVALKDPDLERGSIKPDRPKFQDLMRKQF